MPPINRFVPATIHTIPGPPILIRFSKIDFFSRSSVCLRKRVYKWFYVRESLLSLSHYELRKRKKENKKQIIRRNRRKKKGFKEITYQSIRRDCVGTKDIKLNYRLKWKPFMDNISLLIVFRWNVCTCEISSPVWLSMVIPHRLARLLLFPRSYIGSSSAQTKFLSMLNSFMKKAFSKCNRIASRYL